MNTRNRRQFVRHFAFTCLLLPLIGMSLLSCTHSQPVTGYQTLRAWHQTDPKSAHNFCPYKNELEMFGCTEAEYGAMHRARVEVSRIGEGAASYPDTRSRTVLLDHTDDGAVLGRLLDYDSYGEPSVCDFTPALRIALQTARGQYVFEVCFACSEIFIHTPEPRNGRSRFMVAMSPLLRQDMVRLAQRCFPHDRTLAPVYRKQEHPL